ncbi:hypothetical protein HCN44_010967 [Aphidius gifuensis]|uniref:triacylglycerol lipase n=1 Tax=Aphidius gifuensis TaxID=684658 RepID=A0A834Y786_APHGI|nr:hypothetical protein HCN44_010967 [Aphidius gifuensis]
MNLSFAGCGFLGIYHVGVAVCFKKYAPHLLLDKISGASAGAIAACCLLCDLPLGTIASNVLRVAKEARKTTLGPFSPSFNVQAIMLESLEKYLPNDAHIRVSGKLHISLTRVYDGKNVIVSQFNSREDLFQALLASSFIPLFSGILPPRFHGIRYMDGGFSDNLPTLDENTLTISPFCGESDICPRDTSSQLFHVNFANTSIELSRQNIYRFMRILFPPNPEILSNMCKQGFDDALRFLHRNNLINCNRCLAVQPTFIVSESLDESMEYDPECVECKIHRQEALVANFPDTVMTIFQDAIDSANKGIINWLFKYKGMKLLSILSLPYTFPIDVVYATLTNKQWDNARKSSCIINVSEFGSVDGTLENILQVTSDQETLMAYYYVNENKKIQVSDIFDVASTSPGNIVSLKSGQYDEVSWDEPGWLARHTVGEVSTVDTENENDSTNNLRTNDRKSNNFILSEDELEEADQKINGHPEISTDDSNIFSDPESEWTVDRSSIMPSDNSEFLVPPDSRPEDDQ